MIVDITDPVTSTAIFSVILAVVLFASIRWREGKELFPASVTQELKGLAILLIVFGHTGYYLVSDNKFLQPLSYLAGPGVNIFLFVSGLGLTLSALKRFSGVLPFYRDRLLKLYLPMWLVLTALFAGAAVILHYGYSLEYIVGSFLGLFLHADLYQDINSPLWYFTFILGYYLLFPLVFNKKQPIFTALALLVAGYLVYWLELPALVNVMGLYREHLVAFPLGVAVAWALTEPRVLGKVTWESVQHFLRRPLVKVVYLGVLVLLLALAANTAIYSGVGKEWYISENISLVTTLAIILFFVLKPFTFKFLYLVGVISYEVYLLQWPLGYHYGFLLEGIPGWVSMVIYLGAILGASWLLQKISSKLLQLLRDRLHIG